MSISYVPLAENLSLVVQEVKTKKAITKRQTANNLWIYDRSGSMTWMLPELTEKLIGLSKKLPKNDTLTLGWFSSEGDFDWVFKGFKITENSDYKILEKAIRQHSSPRGCTCFSEILQDCDTVVKDLSAISNVFSLHFFTDGYPVVSNYKKEVDNIFNAIKKIRGKVHTAMYVGCGAYYNRELLQAMSEKQGAILIHSSNIPEYADSITRLINLTDTSEPKEEVQPLVSEPLATYTVTDQGIVIYSVDEDGKLYIAPQKGSDSFIYYISFEKPNKKSWDKIEMGEIDFGDKDNKMAKAIYAGALVLTQQTKTDLALGVMGNVGDKAMVDAITNAFTTEEYGAVENSLNLGIQDVSHRFAKGRDIHYLPPVDAFCVVDALNLLMEDSEAAFFPYHEKFQYERIGVASKAKDGYAKFIADRTSKSPFNTITWHDSRLNLSIQTKVNGTIDLQDVADVSADDVGLSKVFPTYVFRNFTFIKDGRVHTRKFYVSTSESTYKALKNNGVVFDDTFSKDKTYGIDFTGVPAVNRAMATGKTSATELCQWSYEEQKLCGIAKALKFLKNREFGDEVSEKSAQYTDEQAEFLKANGVQVDRGGSYNPPRELEEAKDKYMAKKFEIKIAGLNTLPTVKKVEEKIMAKKNRTPVEGLVEAGLQKWSTAKGNLKDKESRLKWLETAIADTQRSLKEVRTKIQSCKLSVIMGKKWFDEFKSREESTLVVNGNVFTFELGEEAVEI